MPKMTGYSSSKQPAGNGVVPGRSGGGAMRGNSAGKKPPSTAKGACKPAGGKSKGK